MTKIMNRLPVGGILAFSLASTWNLFYLFTTHAAHPGPIFWAPAVMVELVTAGLVYYAVALVRKVTLSNITKQDRKFYAIMLSATLVLALPSLALSVWANTSEFGGVALGGAFPLMSVICAAILGIPDATERKNEQGKKAQAQDAQGKASTQGKMRKASSRGKARQARKASTQGKETRQGVLAHFAQDPRATQAQVAQALGVSRQAIGQHLTALEADGLVERNGQGVKVL